MSQWQERGRALQYFENAATCCAFCGKIIPRRAWVAEHDGLEVIFCDPECERLYHEYWLPRYGRGSDR